jgi:DNA polymerase
MRHEKQRRVQNENGRIAAGATMTKAAIGAADFLPKLHTLPSLRRAVQDCRGCDLYKRATQAVLGEVEGSPARAQAHIAIMLVGEQPGEREDVEGRPFVGPAGKLLDRCLDEAEIERKQVYITNAVKHFKWEPRGKTRLHKKPSLTEVRACRPWLDAEIEAIRPRLLVCLGATAAQSLLGPSFRVTASRGVAQHVAGYPPVLATVHPASILRARTDDDRHRQTAEFIADLRRAAELLRHSR